MRFVALFCSASELFMVEKQDESGIFSSEGTLLVLTPLKS
jgi:hypothetical protein